MSLTAFSHLKLNTGIGLFARLRKGVQLNPKTKFDALYFAFASSLHIFHIFTRRLFSPKSHSE